MAIDSPNYQLGICDNSRNYSFHSLRWPSEEAITRHFTEGDTATFFIISEFDSFLILALLRRYVIQFAYRLNWNFAAKFIMRMWRIVISEECSKPSSVYVPPKEVASNYARTRRKTKRWRSTGHLPNAPARERIIEDFWLCLLIKLLRSKAENAHTDTHGQSQQTLRL